MPDERLILTIGRIERALTRIERIDRTKSSQNADTDLADRHEKLKGDMRNAIQAIDSLIAQKGG